jgi:uncharacterized protein YbaR (Trm112 family)
MHHLFVDLLQCPACAGVLTWDVLEEHADQIETAEATCAACGLRYPVQEGIGVFLTPDSPYADAWEQVESHLSRYLREHPQVERQLLDVPVETLAPADQFLRAMVLEERGEWARARSIATVAFSGLYTPEYLACSSSQVTHVVARVTASSSASPLVDLASGRGTLLEMLAQRLDYPIIATDISPRILRRTQQRLRFLGLTERVTLLAFDARRTPFKDGAVNTLTTHVGLSNIDSPSSLLQELRRIVSGTILATMFFFPEDDTVNAAAIHAILHSPLLFKHQTLEQFAGAGWQVELVNVCSGPAQPTPRAVLLEGTQIDGLPVADTVLEWCVLLAK